MRRLLLLPALLLALACAACGHDEEHTDGHDHAPKYGGRLIELGDHEFQVELLLYPDDGKLEAFLWDGHVEVPVPSAMAALCVDGTVGSTSFSIELKPVKNPYGGDAAGKATTFSGQNDALKGAPAFKGMLVEVTLADKTFKAVAFEYAEDHDHHQDHEHG